jgi:uncharacterized protein (DUF58 family)
MQRNMAHSLALGEWVEVELELHQRNARPLKIDLFDGVPNAHTTQFLPQTCLIPMGGWVKIVYQLRPQARGAFVFTPLHARISSRLGFWWRQVSLDLPSKIRVFPNYASVSRYALLAVDNRLSQLGVFKKRRRGEGLDFHQLREFREGDSLRAVDWKATARMHKLITREYQDERDQQVIFLLDCGRRMRAQDGEFSHFDYALNAILLVAYGAFRQGDAVGLHTVGTEHATWFAPRKAVQNMQALLNTLYDLQPTNQPADFMALAQNVLQRVSKRSLIVIVSNVRDEDDSELLPALRLLQKRHLVLLVSLRESVLRNAQEIPVQDLDDALTYAATEVYLQERHKLLQKLTRQGVLMLDIEPQQLAVSLLNRYLEVKRSGRL